MYFLLFWGKNVPDETVLVFGNIASASHGAFLQLCQHPQSDHLSIKKNGVDRINSIVAY